MKLIELPIGTEVAGIDLREPLSEPDRQELQELYATRHLLLFRGQELTGDQQADVAGLFGPTLPEAGGRFSYISNVVDRTPTGEGALVFHSDFAFTDHPTRGLTLLALEVPPSGSPTRYADAVGALDSMPVALRARIEQLRIVNVLGFKLPTDRRMRERDLPPGSPVTERDFVGRHPGTGVPVINANAMHTDRVVGLPEDESDELLAEVFEVLYGPDNVYEHRWAVGDLIVWDNIALHHGRPDFPAGEPRTLQRVSMGDIPYTELVPNVAELLA